MPNRRMKRSILSLLLLIGLAAPVSAQEAPWYEVELIVFEHVGATARPDISGPSPTAENAHGSNPASSIAPPVATPLPAGDVLSSREYRLADVESALAASRKYRPLLHTAWRQPVLANKQAQPVAVTAPDSAQVTGAVRLYRSRYLHLETDLLYRKAPEADSDAGFRLRDRRRMRSGDLTYFDHPAFGMLVVVSRLERPGEQTVPVEDAPVEEPGAAVEPATGTED